MTDILARLSTSLADRYVIERELGAGGMATVYLAHDVRHDRKVALKVLRPELAAILGGARFLSEIKTTANLQHPHILSLFDSGEADGTVFYVMPYVDGESLRDRLVREKQLPVDDAVRIAKEVASALDYAHRHNVVHRDIKPENILLHDGTALVADFGIALAASRSEGGTRMTETGMSLGTPHYMAPEQAMGEREITPKADIYALGCVLYELLTGEPPFTGPTAQAIIARVMTEQPRSLTLQRHTVPPHVEAVVNKSLEKLPADRCATAADFAVALDARAPFSTRAEPAAEPVRRRVPWRVLVLAAVALAAGVAGGALLLGPGDRPPLLRMSITLPSETPPLAIRLSPDGRTLAYVTGQGDRLAIFTRRLDELTPRRVEGTDDAISVSFSPDGQWLAFIAGASQPRKVPIGGGTAVSVPVAGGAPVTAIEWAGNDRFVVAVAGDLAVLSSDGSLRRFASLDTARAESNIIPDQVLASGRVLGRTWRSPPAGPVIAFDTESGRRDTIVDADAYWSGYADGVLYWTLPDGSLYAAPFEPGDRRLRVPGKPLGGNALAILGFIPPVTAGPGGIAYAPTRPRALVRVARNGIAVPLLITDRTYHNPRVSPDGRRLSLDFTEQARDVWLFDIADSTLTRFGFDSSAHDAEWLPVGNAMLITAVRGGSIGVFRRRLDAGTRAESVLVLNGQISVHGITPDGRTGVAVSINTSGEFDLLRIDLATGRHDTLLGTRYNEGWPVLSPNGRWLAYVSDESGRAEVYVRAFPSLANKVQVSQSGGGEPAWSRDGRELFYRSGGGADPWLVAATFDALGTALRVRARTPLFNVASYEFATPHRNYDVFPDGRSFVMVRQGQPGQRAEIVYVQSPGRLLERR